MRAADAIIAWTPAAGAGAELSPQVQPTAGQVAVLTWPQGEGVLGGYARALGGPEEGWTDACEESVLARLRIAFRTLVMRDGVSPMVVHASFLQIDEYRREIFREQEKSRQTACRRLPAPSGLRRIG